MQLPFRQILVRCGLLGVLGFSGPASAFLKLPEDGPYLPWRLGLSLESVSADMDVRTGSEDSAQDLKYRPAESRYLGIILGYRWLKGTISLPIPSSREIRDLEGESRYRDVRISYFDRVWGSELIYSRYEGYLIENSTGFSAAALNGRHYYTLPDMSSQSYAANLYLVLDPSKYSLSSAIDQSEPVLQSGGSLVVVASARRQLFRNSSEIIPAERRATFGSDANLNFVRATKLSTSFGYGGVWKGPGKFFASYLFALGAGPQKVRFSTTDQEQRQKLSFHLSTHAKVGLGVNADHGFLKVVVSIDQMEGKAGSVRFQNSLTSAVVMGGMRFE